MNISDFINYLEEKNIILNEQQIRQFDIYYEMLIDWNKKINLTSIVNKEEVYKKHFFDSLSLCFYFSLDKQELCDVGAGAGFPSIPLKIVFPNLKVKIVEPLNKRVLFLNKLIENLELNDVEVINIRSEEYLDGREKFDIVTARAVANLSVLTELCLPLVKENGYFIALKGKNGNDELLTAQNAINLLGGTVEQSNKFSLPDNEERFNIYIKKINKTPLKYPRNYAKIKKTPL